MAKAARSLTFVIILLAALMPATATATSNENITLIKGAPTSERTGTTTKRSALFELAQPAWPGRNQCRLDGGALQPCSFEFEARDLAVGAHRLEVVQTDVAGNVRKDVWPWQIVSRQSGLQVAPYCGVTFGTTDTDLHPEYYGARQGWLVWQVENGSGSTISTLPNETTVGDVYSRQAASSWPWWDINLTTFIYIPGVGTTPSTKWYGDSGHNTWPQGTTYISDTARWNPDAPTDVPTDPEFSILSPYTASGAISPYPRYGSLTKSVFPSGWASCLRVIPPVAVIDNEDGTLSATFGWVNHSGKDLKAASPYSVKAGAIGEATLRSFTGAVEQPATMPTAFPAHSSGTWTYTFLDPGTDAVDPITWTVGSRSASLYIRQSAITRGAPGTTLSPWAFINPQTPYSAATRPFVPTANGSIPVSSTATTGGDGSGQAALRIRSRILRRTARIPAAHPGTFILFRNTIRNVGTSDAISLRVCDVLPKHTRAVHTPHHAKVKSQRYCWTASRLAAGASISGTLVLRVLPKAPGVSRWYGMHANRLVASAKNAKTRRTTARFRIVSPVWTGERRLTRPASP